MPSQKFLQDPQVETVFCAKAIPVCERRIKTVAIEESDHESLIAFAQEQEVDWTFVGPEVPLLNGIVDDFQGRALAPIAKQR